MTTSKVPRPGLSPRDRKLLLGFAFFVEVVLLYMVFIDPAMTRLSRARELEERSRRAHAELAAAIAPLAPATLPASAEAALTPLSLAAHEIPTVAIQRALDRMASGTGVRLVQATIDPAPETHGSLLSHAVELEVTGPYEGIAAFIRDTEAREPVRGIEVFSLATTEADLEEVRASMTLRFFLSKP